MNHFHKMSLRMHEAVFVSILSSSPYRKSLMTRMEAVAWTHSVPVGHSFLPFFGKHIRCNLYFMLRMGTSVLAFCVLIDDR